MPRKPEGELPLILLQHGAGACADGAEIESVAAALASRGAAVAAVDLPLHGARGDAKLGDRLARALSGAVGAAPPALVAEFARQAIVDMERSVDALSTLAELDGDRIGVVGFGLGARLVAAFASLDERVGAVALALPGDGAASPELDPRHYIAAIAPRPLWLALPDAGGAASLFDAAREPKQLLKVDAHARPDAPELLAAIGHFLAAPLRLRAA
jgi:dienelactone hydrolase